MKLLLAKHATIVLMLLAVKAGAQEDTCTCNMPALPKIYFKSNSASLSIAAKTTLDKVVVLVKKYPFCYIIIPFYSYGCSQSACNEALRSWNRVHSISKYFESKGVNRHQIRGGEYGDYHYKNIVSLTATGCDTILPTPHPNLQKNYNHIIPPNTNSY